MKHTYNNSHCQYYKALTDTTDVISFRVQALDNVQIYLSMRLNQTAVLELHIPV